MSHQGGKAPGTFVPIPFNMPSILDLPSTSNQNTLSKGLPLYGPLNIKNYNEFLREQRVLFKKCYKQPCSKKYNIDEYQCLYILGRSKFSKIVVAQRKDENLLYALKIYHKQLLVKNKLVDKVLEEKRILQSLDSPFCLRLEFLYQDKNQLTFFLPFISGGEIFTHLQRNSKFTENRSAFYAAQVVLALEYLHHCDVVYRDLKPENLRLDHLGYLKITKFTSAKVVTTRTYTFLGTPEYVAPEMIAGKGYGKSVDWWALGVLVFELNVGYPPFISSNPMKTYKSITKASYTVPSSASRGLRDLLNNLLQPDVSKRAGNLKGSPKDIKNHKWFEGIHWLKLANRQIDPPYVPRIPKQSVRYPTLASTDAYGHHPGNVDEYFKDF